jgi:hypothetical protein
MVPLRMLADALGWGLTFTGRSQNHGHYGVLITHYER